MAVISNGDLRSSNENTELMIGRAITKMNAQGSAWSEKPPTCAAVTKVKIPITADETYGLNLIARANNETGLASACRILM